MSAMLKALSNRENPNLLPRATFSPIKRNTYSDSFLGCFMNLFIAVLLVPLSLLCSLISSLSILCLFKLLLPFMNSVANLNVSLNLELPNSTSNIPLIKLISLSDSLVVLPLITLGI